MAKKITVIAGLIILEGLAIAIYIYCFDPIRSIYESKNRIETPDKKKQLFEPDKMVTYESLCCKLTTVEHQIRKETVLKELRKNMIRKWELSNGYVYTFSGTDEMLDQLTDFIKSERECCGFFTFNLSIAGDKKTIWLEIASDRDGKEFVKTELEL